MHRGVPRRSKRCREGQTAMVGRRSVTTRRGDANARHRRGLRIPRGLVRIRRRLARGRVRAWAAPARKRGSSAPTVRAEAPTAKRRCAGARCGSHWRSTAAWMPRRCLDRSMPQPLRRCAAVDATRRIHRENRLTSRSALAPRGCPDSRLAVVAPRQARTGLRACSSSVDGSHVGRWWLMWRDGATAR
jgi:hypothetical protein